MLFFQATLLQTVAAISLSSFHPFLNCVNITLPSPALITSSSASNCTAFSTGDHARIARYPVAIYYPKSEQDIITAVTCALQSGVRVVPRGGATRKDQVGVATVEAGARLGNVYIALAEHGFNFPGGTCPSVGIGGLIGGGGYGLIARQYGLASDSVLSMRVVLYNGTLITANPTQHSDLFWALRGGNAGSFGIVTQYTIQVYKNPLNTMFFLTYKTEHFPQLIDLFMKHFPTIDRRITTQLQMSRDEIKFWGQFTGSKAELFDILNPTRILSLPMMRQEFRDDCSLVGIKAFPWTVDCSEALDYETVATPFHPDPSRKTYGKFKADYASFPLPPSGAQAILDSILKAPSSEAWIQFETILGSRISDFKVEDSPYVNRQSLYSMQYTVPLTENDTKPNPESPNWAWIWSLESALRPFTNGLHYQNYPDLELGADYGEKYYGAANFARLKKIKAAYDPDNVFRNEQSIPLPSSI